MCVCVCVCVCVCYLTTSNHSALLVTPSNARKFVAVQLNARGQVCQSNVLKLSLDFYSYNYRMSCSLHTHTRHT